MKKIIISCLLTGLVGLAPALPSPNPEYSANDGPVLVSGYKLLVSEYIKVGKIEEARHLSLVTGLPYPTVKSYSGFFTVDEDCGSNIFFWFFPSKNDFINDPVTVWLEGGIGPGTSALCSLLAQHGPYYKTWVEILQLRQYPWNSNSSVIYIDNPVGTGFSYTEKEECYSEDYFQMGQNLLNALQQFFLLFPELQKNPFYIFGETYAGQYAAALAHIIHNRPNSKINLKGIAIGNGWVDPINQIDASQHYYQLGLIDSNHMKQMAEQEESVKKFIENGTYWEAISLKNDIHGAKLRAEIGFSLKNYVNVNRTGPGVDLFVNDTAVREALHVGNATWHGLENDTVFDYLFDEMARSKRPLLEELVEHYQVVLYNGQFDLIFPYVLTINYVQKMNWSGAEEYRSANRSKWYVGEELAGYTKTVKKFTEILVRNAGFFPSRDQPEWMLDLYNKIVFGFFESNR